MLQCTNIHVVLDESAILNGVDLHIAAGQKVALSGQSGCGKTTLLKTILGWHVPDRGDISIGGISLVPGNLPQIRRRMFYLSQDVSAGGLDTVAEYLAYPFSLAVNQHLTFAEESARGMLGTVGLKPELYQHAMYKLSGGEKKRLGLVRGLLLKRDLLLLDEPTSGVDADNRELLVNHLNSLDATVVAVTHDKGLMDGFDRTITLKDGRILQEVNNGRG